MRKPGLKEIPRCPETIVEHLTKVRLERGLSSNAVGRLLGLSKDCVSLWETGRSKPMIHLFPSLITFLGYYPFLHETDSIAGKLQQLLYCNGWNHKDAGKSLNIDTGTVKRILKGQRTFKEKHNAIAELWSQLPNDLKQPYRPL